MFLTPSLVPVVKEILCMHGLQCPLVHSLVAIQGAHQLTFVFHVRMFDLVGEPRPRYSFRDYTTRVAHIEHREYHSERADRGQCERPMGSGRKGASVSVTSQCAHSSDVNV